MEQTIRTKRVVKKTIVARGEPLVKHALAERLRAEIVSGALKPGVRIVEGTWGRKFGVAQGSIREAINILAQEGFVAKASGRSARVVSLSEDDVRRQYELRGALEGLAGRLAAEHKADTAALQKAIDSMRHSAKRNRAPELLDADLAFHLELCRLSGNEYLLEHARRILLPFFAFVRIRVVASGQGTSPWDRELEAHQRILDLVREGEGRVVEQYIQQVMARFAVTAYEKWEKTSPSTRRSSKRRA
jgi:DNA-binding GntR family transcriptional regulator